MKIRAIEEIKEFLEARNSWELIQIIAMLFFLLGLTAGYLIGEYQTTKSIGGQLQKHIITEGDGINPQDYFSIDGTYLYYLVKTNITIEDYRNTISEVRTP
jgi:hypothetical protein